MCDPATLTLAAAAMAAVSTGVGAITAKNQSDYQAKIAERNASMEREAARESLQTTRDEALQHYRKISQMKGQQRAIAAANGVGLDFGTAADVVSDTDALGREDVNRIYKQGFQRTRGFEIQASNYEASANASRAQGKAALVGGALDMGSSILSAAGQYGKMKGSYGGGTGNNSVRFN